MVLSPPPPAVLIAVANSLTGLYFEQALQSYFDITTTPDMDWILHALRDRAPVQPGPALLAKAPSHPVDLVIIEYGDDFEKALKTLAAIKTSLEFQAIPVIMVAVAEAPEQELQALKKGAADFWVLPLPETVLSARVALHTHRAQTTKQLIRYSMMDESTGTASRQLFRSALHMEWLRSVREKSWVSLAFIAMDGYETYAERLGQESVEECIQMLAEALKICLRRPGDLLSRLSGDMFAVLLPMTDSQGAPVVSQHMLNSVSALQLAFPGSVARLQLAEHVSISIGMVSATPNSSEGYDNFTKSAYSALGLAMAEGPSGMRQHDSDRGIEDPPAS